MLFAVSVALVEKKKINVLVSSFHLIYRREAEFSFNPFCLFELRNLCCPSYFSATVAIVKSRDMHWGLLAQKDHKDVNFSSLRLLLIADGANPCKSIVRYLVPQRDALTFLLGCFFVVRYLFITEIASRLKMVQQKKKLKKKRQHFLFHLYCQLITPEGINTCLFFPWQGLWHLVIHS